MADPTDLPVGPETFTGSATATDYDSALEMATQQAREAAMAVFGNDIIVNFSEEKTKVVGDEPPFENQVTVTMQISRNVTEPEPTPEPEPTEEEPAPTEEDPFEKARQDAEDRYNEPGPTEADVPPEKPPTQAPVNKKTDDDNTKPATSAPQPEVKAAATLPGRRMHNPLGDFSSYTYQLSLYIINPDSFNLYSSGQKMIPKDFMLVAQSGGINNDSSVGNPRAPGFDLDVYIDNLVIKTATSGKETMFAGNSHDFTFNIFEPYGFSFPSKLLAAAKAVQAKSKVKRNITDQITALQSQFMLAIRFYGYDKNGKLVTGTDYPQADTKRTDSQCVFERSFPIQICGFNFKLDNKTTVYNIKAKMVSEQTSLGLVRGTLKGQQTVIARTVKDAILGSDQKTGNSSIKGLAQLLNEQQDEWMKPDKDGKTKIGVKDVYKFEFEKGSGIDTALITDGAVEKAPLLNVKNSGQSHVGKSESAKAEVVDHSLRKISVKDGMPILQFIDQIITQSDYIGNAMITQEMEEVQKVQPSDTAYEKKKPDVLSWYNVSPHVSKVLEFDNIRKMFAVEITYVIQKYEIPYVRSTSVGYTSKYYGPHKRYEYWYTGKNTEILNYEQQYNLLYFNAGSASSSSGTQNTSDPAPNSPVSSTNADATGRGSGWFEQANSVKTFLYSPADQLKAKIDILGDPDYLMPATHSGVNMALQKWYGPDFSINPNSGQVFLEIDFRQAEDYKNSTGLLDPSKDGDIVFWEYPPELKNKIKGVAYMLVEVTSTFNKGKFTQELKTCVPPLSKWVEDKKKPAATATNKALTSDENQSDAETARLNAKAATNSNTQSNPESSSAAGQKTSPTGGNSSGGTDPGAPPPYVQPIEDPTSRIDIQGATITTYLSGGGDVMVMVTLPSGKQLPNVKGWGSSEWDAQIQNAERQDSLALGSIKANPSMISSAVNSTVANIKTNEDAKAAYDAKYADWPKGAASAGSSSSTTVADDDSSGAQYKPVEAAGRDTDF